MYITLGADPEFFIYDDKGKPVPAHKMGFPTKEEKTDVYGVAATFRDGYAIELNVTIPVSCRAQLTDYSKLGIQHMRRNLKQGYTLGTAAAVRIRLKSQMKNAPDDVKHFGCEPSFDGYRNGAAKIVPIDAETHPFRYAGGHMHFGAYTNEGLTSLGYLRNHPEMRGPAVLYMPKKFPLLAKMFDAFVSRAMIELWDEKEQFMRRRFYGQAGEYRPQIYGEEAVGFEYRTPPPQLFNHQALIGLFFGVGTWIVTNFEELEKQWDASKETALQRSVNEGRKDLFPVQTVPGFYSPETLKLLRGVKEIHTLTLPDDKRNPEVHGWTELAKKWGLPIPGPGKDATMYAHKGSVRFTPGKNAFNFVEAKAA